MTNIDTVGEAGPIKISVKLIYEGLLDEAAMTVEGTLATPCLVHLKNRLLVQHARALNLRFFNGGSR